MQKNEKVALDWLRKSAAAGYKPAEDRIAEIRLNGWANLLRAASTLSAGSEYSSPYNSNLSLNAREMQERKAWQQRFDAREAEVQRQKQQEIENQKADAQFRRLINSGR